MKMAKKVLSLVLVTMMALAISAATVFAAAPEKGSIEVTGKANQTYTLYKLFDAKITFKADGTMSAIAYTVPEGKSLEGNKWFELNDNGFVVAKEGVTDEWAKDPEAITWAAEFGTQVGETKEASSNGEKLVWDNLDFGYYFVQTTLGSFISVTSDNPEGKVVDKNELPTISKKITATSNGSFNDSDAVVAIGDEVTYTITVGAKAGAQNYVVVDTLPAGITAPDASDVTVSGDGDAVVSVAGGKVTVKYSKAFLDTIKGDTDLTIEFTATLNSDAVIGEPGNASTATLTWGTSDKNTADSETTTVYTAQITIKKTDVSGSDLANAGFVLQNGKNYVKIDNGVVSYVADVDDATELFSGEDGMVPVFAGLADGTYTLVEKTVPDGYNKLAETQVVIKSASEDGALTDANLKQSVTVENKPGVVLPSTGAFGTTMFYIFGVLAILGAGVFMVTNKRMAKEEF